MEELNEILEMTRDKSTQREQDEVRNRNVIYLRTLKYFYIQYKICG